ncbi:MAG TPA: hypothetical protein VK718_00775 [Ferruginibacter sp.]|jgi:hypothetical protein|nr:hypothetical protein [Ferruginibacter sp.]
MTSKNYKLLLVVFVLTLMASTGFAQMSKSYTVYDSSVIPASRMPQQNEFWNNTYNFPAKPRNMWEVGASLSTITISGDVPIRFPTFGFEVHVRKALGYIVSLRLQYVNGIAEGLSWQAAENYGKNPAWNGTNSINYGASTKTVFGNPIFYNYKTNLQDLGLQGIITLNNVRFHKQKTGLTLYGGGGIGVTLYKVMINTTDANGASYQPLYNAVIAKYGGLSGLTYKNRNNIRKDLKHGTGGIAGMDNTYETNAESEDGEQGRRPVIGSYTVKPSGTVLVGLAYRLSRRINIELEDRQTFVKSDLLDGQRWQEQPQGDAVLTSDFDSWNALSLGININLGGKSVEPLWWLNPLDYAYSELNNPHHIKFPKPVFDDEDGDGVVDQLDREPNTPAGCPVDTHGVTKDTDGDGVPDCKDKQLITPTECQPVDADGVGKCPDPACCSKMRPGGDTTEASCPTDYPSISLKGLSGLSSDSKAMLASVGEKLKASPNCSITITGYSGPNKKEQATANKKLGMIKKYLTEKLGISEDRITVAEPVIGQGDADTIDIKSN